MSAVCALVMAAGRGARMATEENKLFAQVRGKTVLGRCLSALRGEVVQGVWIVAREGEQARCAEIAAQENAPLWGISVGGETRQESVYKGLQALYAQRPDDALIVLIHDGARMLVEEKTLRDCVRAVEEYGSGVTSVPLKDTVKRAREGWVVHTPDRDGLVAVQTPQGFRLKAILEAHGQAAREGYVGTDDAMLLERYGGTVRLVRGEYANIKVTTPEDLVVAEALLEARERVGKPAGKPAAIQPQSPEALELPAPPNGPLRVGQGFDAHTLVPGRRLVLCGVEIPYERGLLGHSDADVATHALMDAILGALAWGDIGRLFPDTDPRYRGADSVELLRTVVDKGHFAGWLVGNADVTIIAQKPKLAPYRQGMREKLAEALGVAVDCVNVKASTTEGMGFTGTGEGIAAFASVTLYPELRIKRTV